MFKHNLLIALRNLFKYRLQSIVGILSVALGMVFCSLTYIWIRYERSFDTFHRDADDIYLVMSRESDDVESDYTYTSFPEAEYLADKFPQIEEFARCGCGADDIQFFIEGKEPVSLKGRSVDANFQSFFDVKVLEGRDILNLSSNEVALTKKYADLVFGGNAVGQTVFTMQGPMSIVAVIDNPGEPSSIGYDFLYGTDIRLQSRYVIGTLDFVRVNRNNLRFLSESLANDTAQVNLSNDPSPENAFYIMETKNYKLLPIQKIREDEVLKKNNINLHYIYILLLLGLVMIVSSLTNYFTMLVTRIGIRTREISLRYANGASFMQIIRMFSMEISVVLISAMLAGAVICMFTLPYFSTLSTIDRSFGFFIGGYLLYSVVIGIVSILVASVIAFAVSKRQLARSLGKTPDQSRSYLGYKVSIGFQLAVSLCAIFCTVVMQKQISHLLGSSDMGYVKHNIGKIVQLGFSESNVAAVRDQLNQYPEIEMLTYGFNSYDAYNGTTSISLDSIRSDTYEPVRSLCVVADRRYLELIGVQLLTGELFRDDEQGDVIILNETLARKFGTPDQLIGKTIYYLSTPCVVRGVVKDLCFLDPKADNVPLFYVYKEETTQSGMDMNHYIPFYNPDTFLFRFKEGTDWKKLEDKITEMLRSMCPGQFFNLWNMEEEYIEEYLKSEISLRKLLMIITVVCIIIAVSGVFSIVSLSCERRRREIAVRKINGAKASDILRLFLRDYLPVILASAVVAFPIGSAIMHRWQSGYIRQAPVGVWTYLSILAGMIVFIGLIIFNNIRRASSQNPADVIKSE